jgi:hypothetical protein
MSVLREHLDFSMSTDQSVRVRECDNCIGMGNSPACQITRKEDGFLWHCFRCHKSGFFPDDTASESDVRKLQARAKKEDTRPEVVTLPPDYTTTLPPKAAVQLYNLELTPDDIERYDIGWSPSHGRIIVPVYKYAVSATGIVKRLVGVVGRKLIDDDPKKAKWWTVRQRDIKNLRFVAPYETNRDRKQVVIVENVFSAIKCNKASNIYAIALITSYLPHELFTQLRGWKAFIWLDQDAYDKACKYQAKLGNYGVTSAVVLTEQKPKDCTPETIREKLIWNS